MKAALFLGAGIFQHALDSTAFAELRGAGRAYPGVFGLFALAGLAPAGVPPLAGFWSKDAIEAATSQAPTAAVLLPLALVGSALTGAYVARALSLLWFGSAKQRPVPGLGWMLVGLGGLTLVAGALGPSLGLIAQLVGQPLPDNTTTRLLGLAATLLGLVAGWSGLTERLVAPIAVPAARGFRLGDGWISIAVRPALRVARTCDRVDRQLYALGPGLGRLGVRLAGGPFARTDAFVEAAVQAVADGGLALARGGRRFDEAELDGLIAQLVRSTRALGGGARRLQSGFVSRELVLAACGAAVVFVLALAVR
jgi:NADH-quinone oxidoreductase subunit L